MSVLPVERTARRWAEMSDDGVYRFVLGRRWDESLPECVFIMLNPSTADASEDDPTIGRCLNFAKNLGCGSLQVGNLYAFRATDPNDLFKTTEPTGGAKNDAVLAELLSRGEIVIAGWGAHAKPDRVAELLRLPGANRITALGTTKAGAPRHPLYVHGATILSEWRSAS